jgi:hypothetical protein
MSVVETYCDQHWTVHPSLSEPIMACAMSYDATTVVLIEQEDDESLLDVPWQQPAQRTAQSHSSSSPLLQALQPPGLACPAAFLLGAAVMGCPVVLLVRQGRMTLAGALAIAIGADAAEGGCTATLTEVRSCSQPAVLSGLWPHLLISAGHT